MYNADIVDEESTFEKLANNEDKLRNKMNIIIDKKKDSTIGEKIKKSNEIICPKCKENVLIKIKDYKISMYNCKNNDRIEDIKINEFKITQKIDISKIICNECKNINKGKTYNNEFYRCLECNENLCPICKTLHNNNHIIIEYDKIK